MTSSSKRDRPRTSLYCLIGHNVEYSLSPEIHNAAFKKTGINAVYFVLNIPPTILTNLVSSFKRIALSGFNVTIPHKEAIIPLLDHVDSLASTTGAVNTVIAKGRKLHGYNTDVQGILTPLRSRGINIKNMRALILGGGGTARACVSALASEGCKEITILNRDGLRARKLANIFGEAFQITCHHSVLSNSSSSKALENCELVFNATPMGGKDLEEKTPIPTEKLTSEHVVFDAVYRPRKTRLLGLAEESGAITIPGYEMLLEQGAASFELWTGTDAPRDVMKKT
ncbi:MAG: shikimate dehydrogenase, partial [Nitrososphaerales archaeon]